MFDMRVTKRNPKTGAIISTDPYRLRITKEGKTFERPVGSGNLWYEDGEVAGIVKMVEGKEKIMIDTPHLDYAIPVSKEQAVIDAMANKDSQIAKLEQDLKDLELKAINAEREAKVEEIVEAKTATMKAKPETKKV